MNNEGRSGIFKTSILLTPTFLQMHKLLNIDSETGPTSNGEHQLFPILTATVLLFLGLQILIHSTYQID